MRRPLVAGNWKMFKTVGEARVLVSEMLPSLTEIQGVDIVLCPPFTSILPVAAMLEGTSIAVGAQNMHWEASGAYTGEVAAPMLAELCKYVIIGHSERRQYFGETDQTVNRKVFSALGHQLTPILCIGETLAENEAGLTAEVVSKQLRAGLDGIEATSAASIVIAYEPVWAIGTGRSATAEGADTAQLTRILYGGSVKASNAAELFTQPDIDGALVGGASLKAAEFIPIVAAAAR
jgi:triosephosphate isomerase